MPVTDGAALRYPTLWHAGGWLLVAAVVGGSLMPGDSLGTVGAVHDKLLHAGAYCLLMVWFAGLYPRSRHGVIAVVLLAFGLGLEIAQDRLVSRQFDPLDLAANATGVLAGLALSWSVLERWCARVEQRLLSLT